MSFLTKLFKPYSIELAGTWTGHYGYGAEYPKAVHDTRVKFIAQILKGEGRSFTGTVKEFGGIDEIANIDGWIEKKTILFTKTYEQSYTVDEQGVITPGSHGPQHVIYEGVYHESTRTFKGKWRIEATYHFEDGSKKEHTSSGNWELKKD